MINFNSKIVLCGGAGLVGMNLVHRLIQRGHTNICVIDKHKANLKILKNIFPEVSNIYGDLSQHGEWENSFKDAEILVMLQAQIGGNKLDEFKENNIDSTKNILNCYKKFGLSRLVHVSSSVVKSEADDYYSQTKNQQELLVQNSGIVCPILPIFPVPGKGNYIRQPLYVGDFCNIIISCIGNNSLNGIYNISGMEKVFYIDIITHVKKAINSNTLVIKIPYTLFYILLHTWSLFDKNPPFTVKQLQALVIKEEFEITDWPQIFNIKSTSYVNAINETFNDSTFSKVTLDF